VVVKHWLHNMLTEILTKQDLIIETLSDIQKEQKMAAETIVEKISREAVETRGAVATMAGVLDKFAQYVLDHLNDQAALEAAALEMQGAQDDIAASMARNPVPGEVVVVPPEV
jgi:hypothetical protein